MVTYKWFNYMGDVIKYINQNNIQKDDIYSILTADDSGYIIIYFERI